MNLLFNVGDLVRRTHPDFNHMVGVVVEVVDRGEVVRNSRRAGGRGKYVPQLIIWVRWQLPKSREMESAESYWIEDLQVISKYNK